MNKDGTKSTTVHAGDLERNNFYTVIKQVNGQLFVSHRYKTSGDCEWQFIEMGGRTYKISGAKQGIRYRPIKRYKLLPFSTDTHQMNTKDYLILFLICTFNTNQKNQN